MMGTKERNFGPLPEDISLEYLVPEDNFYRRLQEKLGLGRVGRTCKKRDHSERGSSLPRSGRTTSATPRAISAHMSRLGGTGKTPGFSKTRYARPSPTS